MKFSTALVLAGALRASASCAADNCVRAITGTRHNIASRLADCNSYFSATVTLTASTVTQTTYSVIGNSAYAAAPSIKRRDTPVIPNAVPAYASIACTSKNALLPVSARYSTACLCAGATHATTTISVTATTGVVATVTSFKILATASAVSSGVPQYLVINTDSTQATYQEFFLSATDPGAESIYSLTDGLLTTLLNDLTEQDPEATSQWVFVYPLKTIISGGFIKIYFIVDPITLAVTALNAQTGHSVLQVCFQGGVAYLNLAGVAGTREQVTGEACFPVKLNAVPML